MAGQELPRSGRRAPQDKERQRQQGDQEGPHSSQGLDPEPGRPTDKVPRPTGNDAGTADESGKSLDSDEPVNTGGHSGPDNTD